MSYGADLVQGEIPRRIQRRPGEFRLNPDFPHDGRCAGGHFPAPPIETRFFHVFAREGSTIAEILSPGVYCEWCLTVANRLKPFVKAGKEPDFDPEAEVERLLEEAWERERNHYG